MIRLVLIPVFTLLLTSGNCQSQDVDPRIDKLLNHFVDERNRLGIVEYSYSVKLRAIDNDRLLEDIRKFHVIINWKKGQEYYVNYFDNIDEDGNSYYNEFPKATKLRVQTTYTKTRSFSRITSLSDPKLPGILNDYEIVPGGHFSVKFIENMPVFESHGLLNKVGVDESPRHGNIGYKLDPKKFFVFKEEKNTTILQTVENPNDDNFYQLTFDSNSKLISLELYGKGQQYSGRYFTYKKINGHFLLKTCEICFGKRDNPSIRFNIYHVDIKFIDPKQSPMDLFPMPNDKIEIGRYALDENNRYSLDSQKQLKYSEYIRMKISNMARARLLLFR